MRIIRPGESRYPSMSGVTRRFNREPIGVELVRPENFTDLHRKITSEMQPACVAFDPSVTEMIVEGLMLWPADMVGLHALEDWFVENVFNRYGQSLSLWTNRDTNFVEITRVMVEEFCDADQEGLLRVGPPGMGWIKDDDAIATWRAARLLVLKGDELGP